MRIERHDSGGDRRWWGAVRFALGMVQMAGAVVALVLLGTVGVTALSLAVVVVTGLCTTVSVLLFGSRQGPSSSRKERER